MESFFYWPYWTDIGYTNQIFKFVATLFTNQLVDIPVKGAKHLMMTEGKVIKPFRFKQFEIQQDRSAMKVGTDGVLLGAWVNLFGSDRILDVGTGTGVIAIMLAQRTENARVDGVDVDEASATQAAENMKSSVWSERLRAIQQPIQEFARQQDEKYDLIVSNPPFFSGGTFSDKVERTQVRHTIKLPHGDLLRAVQQLLSPEGRFALILPLIEGLRFKELAESYQLFCVRKCEVRSRPSKPVERLLMEFSLKKGSMVEESLTIQEEKGEDNWTEGYKRICQDFFLFI